MYRLNDHGMFLGRMALSNWLDKGAGFIKRLVETLKNMAMEKDTIVNCDETWCKVKLRDRYRKRYIWCLVNCEEKIVINGYEEGSRSRDALKKILGNRQLKALQSDGYNVYMYLNQIFVYLKDGRYNIDNTIAERFIRPLAGERKNSLFFGNNRMANVSAAYHTLISTCRANGIPALAYLKKFFRELAKGHRDYENLLPMTIGINANKLKNQVRFLKILRGKLSKEAFPMGYVKIGRLLCN